MTIELTKYNSWLSGEKIEGAKFNHNSYVEVIAGENTGSTGSIVSLVSLGDCATYIVEIESGFDIEVYENQIVDKNS